MKKRGNLGSASPNSMKMKEFAISDDLKKRKSAFPLTTLIPEYSNESGKIHFFIKEFFEEELHNSLKNFKNLFYF